MDIADEWLRANDEYYTDKRKNKKAEQEYPYETEKQDKRRMSKEIPFSNLRGKSLYILSNYNIDIDKYNEI